MAIIEINKLVKSYVKSKFTLNINNLHIEEGSILGLLGPNGAGKSTLLEILMDNIRPDEGSVKILSYDIKERDLLKNLISYMPENKNLYGNLKVEQMIKLAASISSKWNKDKANELLNIFDLERNKKISTLSYGEKTQLYGVITLSRGSQVLIMDEPTRGLDPVMQDKMLQLIKEESLLGKTIIFSSHQINELEETADSAVIIKEGKIILKGNLDDLKEELFYLSLNPEEINTINKLDIEILSQKFNSGQSLLLCRSSNRSKNELSQMLPQIRQEKVNLKDIFLLLMERKEAK